MLCTYVHYVMQVKGWEAAGSLQLQQSGLTRRISLQAATEGLQSMEPAVSNHAEPIVAAVGPKNPEQGPDLSATQGSVEGEFPACICKESMNLLHSAVQSLCNACVARLPSIVTSHRWCTG